MIDVLFNVVLPVLLVAAVGGLVGQKLGFSTETMSKAVFFLFSPCLVFTSIANIEVDAGEIGRLIAVAIGVFIANAVIAYVWASFRRIDAATRTCALFTAVVVNQGNMGLPIAKLAFGDVGLQIAVVMFVTGVVLWSSAGIAIGSWSRGRHSGWRAMLAPLRYPSIYAAALGTLVNVTNIDLPVLIRESTSSLGEASIPCMLVVLGLQFRVPKLDDLTEPLAATVNRLVVGPLVAWPLVAAIGLDGVPGRTSIMMAGMPTAVMTTILCTELDARADLAVTTVIVSTLASIASLTVLIAILR